VTAAATTAPSSFAYFLSIFYNSKLRRLFTIPAMKKSFFAIFLVVLSPFSAASHAESTPAGEKGSRLSPIAFLTVNDWLATLPNGADGKTVAIHAHFTWAENRQAIRVSNQFVIDGKPVPYIDGIYFWNPQTQTIEFVWLGAEGDVSRGSVTPGDGKLVHDFQVTHADGKSDSYVARVTPQPDGSWTNEILTKKNGNLSPVIQVTYVPERK
jgi:hypothetical protein